MKTKLIEIIDGLREELTPNAYIKISNAVRSLPDDQPDLLPFQWPIPDGMEVVTRDGRKVEQLVRFEGVYTYPIVGVVNKHISRWTNKGFSLSTEQSDNYDLFLRRKEKSHDDKIFISIMEDFYDKYYNHTEGDIGEDPLPEAFQRLKTYFTTLKPVV